MSKPHLFFLAVFVCLASLAGGPEALAVDEPAARPSISEALRSGDILAAARRARELAEADDVEAQFNLALFHWHGVAIPQNFEEALRWSTLAAVSGHKKAAGARARMMRTVDPGLSQKAMDWSRLRLTKAAENGDDGALLALARSYAPEFSFGSESEAYFWTVLAVSSGKIEARRQRDALVTRLKQADILKAQARANEWFGRHRKDRG